MVARHFAVVLLDRIFARCHLIKGQGIQAVLSLGERSQGDRCLFLDYISVCIQPLAVRCLHDERDTSVQLFLCDIVAVYALGDHQFSGLLFN